MVHTLISINNYHYPRGGAEAVYLEHNKMLNQAGWRVVPFAMEHPQNLETEWKEYFVSEIEFGNKYGLLQQAKMASKVLYSFEAKKKLAALVAKTQPVVCHAHNVYHHISPAIYSMLAACGIPTVQTVHDLKLACPAYKMLTHDGVCERCLGGNQRNVVFHKCIKNSYSLSSLVYLEAKLHATLRTYERYVDKLVAPSHFVKDKLIESGVDADKLVYIPNFVEVPELKERNFDDRLFAFIGRLSEEKGLPTLIKATAKADTKLRIIGTGPMQDELRSLASSEGADVEFTGHLTGVQLDQAIRQAASSVLPSECYENAPMSILESYAKGIPVIGAKIGGIPEMIEEGTTGHLFTSGSVDSLADALSKIASADATAVNSMGKAGYELVKEKFSAEIYQNNILELYTGLMSGVR